MLQALDRSMQTIKEQDAGTAVVVDEDLLRDPAEQILGEQLVAIARMVEPKFRARQYTEALQDLAVLRKAVDEFFDSVMVMAEDPALRANRLALLRRHVGVARVHPVR